MFKRRKSDSKSRRKRVASIGLIFMLVITQLFIVFPAIQECSHAAGGSLEVRVKYFGDRNNKIRTKTVFSESDLRNIGMEEWCYSNVTNYGSVMVMRAQGPAVTDVIAAAGIDLSSVNRINFRAGDNYGYTRDFTVEKHLSGGRYYYPNLNFSFKKSGSSIIPVVTETEEGTIYPLDPAYEVPSILALAFSSTKASDTEAEDLPLETNEVYRFCMGQTPLTEGVATNGSKDVTSAESIKLIHGIDVTLYGSPVDDIMMDLTDGQLKVGSKKKIGVSFSGDELFADDLGSFAGKLKWKSSDPSVIKVDQKGNITVLKKGKATITVTASNGMSASVTISAVDDPKKKKEEAIKGEQNTNSTSQKRNAASSARSTKAPAKKYITVREVNIGDQMVPQASVQDQMREAMANDAEALGKISDFDKGAAAGTGGAALLVGGAGAFLRIRRFWRDTM